MINGIRNRQDIQLSRRWVIKLGSSLVTNDGAGLAYRDIARWAAEIASLRAAGYQVVVVSSGAVAAGMSRLGRAERPHALHEQQAMAAIGQMGLVQAWEQGFSEHDLVTAQVLLTHEDMSDRQRYLNARSTLRGLLELGAIPVINENDTVTTDEIRFGDNDTLAALVANLVEADLLVILTDQNGLFDADPRQNPAAKLVSMAEVDRADLAAMAGEGGALGRGGMRTKLTAAARAARSGTATVIAGGRNEGVLVAVARGDDVGTLLLPGTLPMAAKKQWLAGQLQLRGRLVIDDGAARVLRQAGRSLLPVGVKQVSGSFKRGELVAIVDQAGRQLGTGLVNYSAAEAQRLCGVASDQIEAALGYVDDAELVHRDNMVITAS